MKGLNSFKGSLFKNREKALAKLNSFQENFTKKEKEIKTDLEEANRIWRKVGKNFKWWQSLP